MNKEKITEIIADMRHVATDDSAHGHGWSQTVGDSVYSEVVEKWAAQLEVAINGDTHKA